MLDPTDAGAMPSGFDSAGATGSAAADGQQQQSSRQAAAAQFLRRSQLAAIAPLPGSAAQARMLRLWASTAR